MLWRVSLIVVTISAAISVTPGPETICTYHSTMHFSENILSPLPREEGRWNVEDRLRHGNFQREIFNILSSHGSGV